MARRFVFSTLLIASLAGIAAGLSGCVVVPYDNGHRHHYGHSWDHHDRGHWRGGYRR